MRYSQKIAKIGTGQAWQSFINSYYRWRRPLSAGRLEQELDPAELARIRREFGTAAATKTWRKYVNAREWIALAIRQARELQLDRRRGLRILDLGSGAGYFLYVCRKLGHRGLGLDLGEPTMYESTFRLMGLQRVIWQIRPYEPLPPLGRFDLVTAFAVCFNGHDTPQVWGAPEWEFFLEDLSANVLEPSGAAYLELNPEPYGPYTPELHDFFVRRAARVNGKKIWFNAAATPEIR